MKLRLNWCICRKAEKGKRVKDRNFVNVLGKREGDGREGKTILNPKQIDEYGEWKKTGKLSLLKCIGTPEELGKGMERARNNRV